MTAKMQSVDFKLAVRGDSEAGVIRAFFCHLDGTDKVDVATFSMQIAREHPELFEKWREFLNQVLTTVFVAVTGEVPVLHEHWLHESN